MNSKNSILIAMPIFGVREKNGKKLLNFPSIINYGEELPDGTIVYITKDGEKRAYKNEFNNSYLKLFKIDEICLDNLMSGWKQFNNSVLPVILDESIETLEVYGNHFSPLKIMVERRKDCIAIKPVFE